MGANLRNDGRGIRNGDAELLIFVRGGQKIVRVGVHTGVDSKAHFLHDTGSCGSCGNALDLNGCVKNDAA